MRPIIRDGGFSISVNYQRWRKYVDTTTPLVRDQYSRIRSTVRINGCNTWIRVCRCLAESVNGKLVVTVFHCLDTYPGEQHGQRCSGLSFDLFM